MGLQTDKTNDLTKTSSLFDHCNVTLNIVKYPMLDANADFTKFQFMPFYRALSEFNRSFYGVDPLVGSANVTPVSYQELTPLFIIDVKKQSERLDTENIPAKIAVAK